MARNNLVKRALRGTWSLLGSMATCGCVVVILPFFTAGLVVVKCHRCIKHYSRQGNRVYLKSETFHPLPLPLRRRFNISDPSILLSSQGESRLMSLPYEIREKIWKFALGEHHTLDIRHEPRSHRLHYLMVPGYELIKRLNFGRAFHLSWHELVEDLERVATSNLPAPPAFALIKVCRQIYTECMPILYSCNTFRFTDLTNVCFFNQGMRRHWAARLKSLSLVLRLKAGDEMDSWSSAWFQIETWMTGLTHLSLEMGTYDMSDHRQRHHLLSVARLSGLSFFRMQLWNMETVQATSVKLGKFGRTVKKAVKRPRGSALSPVEVSTLDRLVFADSSDDEEDDEEDEEDDEDGEDANDDT